MKWIDEMDSWNGHIYQVSSLQFDWILWLNIAGRILRRIPGEEDGRAHRGFINPCRCGSGCQRRWWRQWRRWGRLFANSHFRTSRASIDLSPPIVASAANISRLEHDSISLKWTNQSEDVESELMSSAGLEEMIVVFWIARTMAALPLISWTISTSKNCTSFTAWRTTSPSSS